MSFLLVLDGLVFACVLVWIARNFSTRRRRSLRLPPGPDPLPLVGNALELPSVEPWLALTEMAQSYGDVIYMKNLRQPIVFLNSYDAAVDLLEKKSAKYSSRPGTVMLNELQGWNWALVNKPYGEEWRKQRAPLQKTLESGAIVKYLALQKRETYKFLAKLIQSPKEYDRLIRASLASFIMMITYGHEVLHTSDPFVTLAEEGVAAMTYALTPGAFLVDIIPWLKYVPGWFPGAKFKEVAKKGAELSYNTRWKPYRETKDDILKGKALPSFTTDLIEDHVDAGGQLSEVDDDLVSAITGITFIAGADTTVSALLSFVLAMVLFPDVQRRAQEELDRVIGHDRLPDFDDRALLPYNEAVFKECLRWQPITALGVPHKLDVDDVYRGYFIPSGTTVVANQWAMSRDPVEYPEPELFKPERFLPKDGEKVPRDPSKFAFGFGRRICPGRHLAENTVFITVVSVLATFKISKAIDSDGNTIEPKIEFNTSIVRHPAPFDCVIEPRSEKAVALIQQISEAQA